MAYLHILCMSFERMHSKLNELYLNSAASFTEKQRGVNICPLMGGVKRKAAVEIRSLSIIVKIREDQGPNLKGYSGELMNPLMMTR